MAKMLLLALALGCLVGLSTRTVTTQQPDLAYGADSVSGAATVIQTDGSNALKVLGK